MSRFQLSLNLVAAGMLGLTASRLPPAQTDNKLSSEVRQAMAEGRESLQLWLSPSVVRTYALETGRSAATNTLLQRYLELIGTGCMPDPDNASSTPLCGMFQWRDLPVTYKIDMTGAPAYLNPVEVKAAICRAFESWDAEEIPAGELFREVADDAEPDVKVVWRDLNPSYAGFANLTVDFTIQEPVEAEIALNPNIAWAPGLRWGFLPFDCGFNPPPGWPNLDTRIVDVQSVATHEIGHVLNLGHVTSAEKDIGQTMFFSIVAFSTYQHTPGNGDKNGLRGLFKQ